MQNKKRFDNYIKNYFFFLSSLLITVVLINLIIDPHGDFRLIDIRGFNSEKLFAPNGGNRRKKANDITYGKYDTIIIGTSRVLYSLSPKHPKFTNKSAYNLAFAGTNMYEIAMAYKYAQKKQQLKTVVLGLDFLTFSDVRDVSGDFNQSKFYDQNNLLNQIQDYLSLHQLSLSLNTVKVNFQGKKIHDISGFLNRGNTEEYRVAFDKILTTNFFVNQKTYAGYSYSQHRLNLFRELVADCLANNIKLYLFISPVHARQLEAMSVMGLFPTFEQWKRDLVTIVQEEANKQDKPSPLLWDFSGYNSITTEKIPLPGTLGNMNWYHESSHYTEKLGNMVLDIMFSYSQKVIDVPEDFGVIITSENIDRHLAKIRKNRQKYQIEQAFEVAEVKRLFKEVQSNKN